MDPELVQRVEEFFTTLAREQYRALAGLTTEPALAAVYERYADLFRTDILSALADAEAAAAGEGRRRLRALACRYGMRHPRWRTRRSRSTVTRSKPRGWRR